MGFVSGYWVGLAVGAVALNKVNIGCWMQKHLLRRFLLERMDEEVKNIKEGKTEYRDAVEVRFMMYSRIFDSLTAAKDFTFRDYLRFLFSSTKEDGLFNTMINARLTDMSVSYHKQDAFRSLGIE